MLNQEDRNILSYNEQRIAVREGIIIEIDGNHHHLSHKKGFRGREMNPESFEFSIELVIKEFNYPRETVQNDVVLILYFKLTHF